MDEHIGVAAFDAELAGLDAEAANKKLEEERRKRSRGLDDDGEDSASVSPSASKKGRAEAPPGARIEISKACLHRIITENGGTMTSAAIS